MDSHSSSGGRKAQLLSQLLSSLRSSQHDGAQVLCALSPSWAVHADGLLLTGQSVSF